jgi:hypothetical protein
MDQLKKLFATLAVALCATTSLAQPFTYQGELSQSGSPANTLHDFEFRVFAVATGGVQLGTTTFRPGTLVENGVFTATVDAGLGVFNGQERWLEVAVRTTGSGDPYTTLAPRQRITAAPYSLRSLSERWTDVGGGVLSNDSSVQRIFINRTSPITGAEYFGITAPVGNGSFGGMYVNTTASQGMPFYGYSTAGIVRAYHFLDTQQNWVLVNGSQSVMVSAEGNVGIGTAPSSVNRVFVNGDVAATGNLSTSGTIDATSSISSGANVVASGSVITNSYLYASPKTRKLAIASSGLQPQDAAGRAAISLGAGFATHQQTTTHRLFGTVSLPEGATVVSLKLLAVDNAVNNIRARLHNYVALNGFSYIVAEVTTSGAAPSAREFVSLASAFPPVEHVNRTWSLEVELPGVTGGEFCSFAGAIIEYTVTSPD